ncbi:hypothetical protein [Streptomyces inhibens]|uniref:hypothetical protein n=1 Tax=Streptomyces inhibens TaxID=2293571 RepID=UPI001EE70F1C|nr:hypothetical protein [Streptomyces inhibens]UKY54395.1 hypothetical protein KI385_40035 [Streptomyces inhibens]
MSDGDDSGGYGDDSGVTGSPTRNSRSESLPNWSVLRRAMRWETLVLVVVLVILAAAMS